MKEKRHRIILLVVLIITAMIACENNPADVKKTIENENAVQTGIDLVLAQTEIDVGATLDVAVVALFSDGTSREIEAGNLKWILSADGIIQLNGKFLVALSAGEVDLQVESDYFKVERHLTINEPIDLSGLMISEVMYDAVGSDTGKEYIEIVNCGNTEINLSGFYLIDGSSASQPFVFPEYAVIHSGEYMMISSAKEDFKTAYGFYPDYWVMKFALNNSGETVRLFDNRNRLVDQVFIEGGTSEFGVPDSWGSKTDPVCVEGESALRLVYAKNFVVSDWGNGLPSPRR